MKYEKCPRCELNYKLVSEQYCKVCQNEIDNSDIDDENEFICPFCYKNIIGYDDIMCEKCMEKRKKAFEDKEK